jgi:hypothetical protein
MASDADRDGFFRTVLQVQIEVGCGLEAMRQHELFKAMLVIHGTDQVRQWLLLDALRCVRLGEFDRRLQALRTELEQRPDPEQLGTEHWRALHRRHGLALDREGLDAVLADDEWLHPGMLEYIKSMLQQVGLGSN